MPLTAGTWKAVVNGADVDLVIDPPDQHGVLAIQFGPFSMRGMWDESSQMLTFAWLVNAGQPDPIIGIFTAYVFRSPRNPAPGQDQIATLAGTVDLTVNAGGGPNQMFPGATHGDTRTVGWRTSPRWCESCGPDRAQQAPISEQLVGCSFSSGPGTAGPGVPQAGARWALVEGLNSRAGAESGGVGTHHAHAA